MNIFVAYHERIANYSASEARAGSRISGNHVHGVAFRVIGFVSSPFRGSDTHAGGINDGSLRALNVEETVAERQRIQFSIACADDRD